MPLTLLTTAILAGIELSINNVLKLDPASQNKLEALEGSTLSVKCLSPNLEIFIIVRNKNLVLSSYFEQTPDTCISGQANALFKLLIAKDKNQAFYNEDIEITGDLELAQALQNILSNLNIDWEYHLSKFVGDIPTETFSTGLAKGENFFQETRSSLEMNIDEYIHEEKKLFPSAQELEGFYQSIDRLRLRLDRLNAKFNHLNPDNSQT